MPSYVENTITAFGKLADLAQVKKHWDGMMVSQPSHDPMFQPQVMDFTSEHPDLDCKSGCPYYDSERHRTRISNGALKISAVSNNDPPLNILEAISERWPGVEFVLSCTIEHELHERWRIQNGDCAIVDRCFHDIRSGTRSWVVKDGFLFGDWQEWASRQWVSGVPQTWTPPGATKEEATIAIHTTTEA